MLSICIPTFNYGHYLGEAIESCLSQEADFELIVCDDNSTDETSAVREKYIGDRRMRWFDNPGPRLSIQDNWNRAVRASSRPYIKVLPADDRLLPGSIENINDMVRRNLHAIFHTHLAQVIDSNGQVVRHQVAMNPSGNEIVVTGAAALKGKLRQRVRFREPACNVFRKDVWESIGGYSSRYRFVFDVHLNVRLLQSGPCMMWMIPHAQIRRHGASDGSRLNSVLALVELRSLTLEILDMLGEDADLLDRSARDGWLIYRCLELAAQRRSMPKENVAWIAGELGLGMLNPCSWGYALAMAYRRLRTGDVQGQCNPRGFIE